MKAGLYPFNPDRMVRDIQKPLAELSLPKADEVKVGSCPQDEVLKTPVTPVSAEALTSLHNLIKQDAHTLMRRVYSAYRGMYRSSPMPSKYPLPNVPSSGIKINS